MSPNRRALAFSDQTGDSLYSPACKVRYEMGLRVPVTIYIVHLVCSAGLDDRLRATHRAAIMAEHAVLRAIHKGAQQEVQASARKGGYAKPLRNGSGYPDIC